MPVNPWDKCLQIQLGTALLSWQIVSEKSIATFVMIIVQCLEMNKTEKRDGDSKERQKAAA